MKLMSVCGGLFVCSKCELLIDSSISCLFASIWNVESDEVWPLPVLVKLWEACAMSVLQSHEILVSWISMALIRCGVDR